MNDATSDEKIALVDCTCYGVEPMYACILPTVHTLVFRLVTRSQRWSFDRPLYLIAKQTFITLLVFFGNAGWLGGSCEPQARLYLRYYFGSPLVHQSEISMPMNNIIAMAF